MARPILAGGIAIALLFIPAVHAQQAPMQGTPPMDPGPSAGEDPCEVVPADETKARSVDEFGMDESDGSLSEMLDRCGSVLSPPPVGDTDFIAPPPDQGVTPILPPPAVPEAE